MPIKYVIFDVGNVIVRWDPAYIISQSFSACANQVELVQQIFKSETWMQLNKGQISQNQAIDSYSSLLGFQRDQLENVLEIAKQSLTLVPGTLELIQTLKTQQFSLYALTDNTHEFMRYLKTQYDFWKLFQGIVVSAEEGHLKPSKEIFQILLQRYGMLAHEAVFIDDVEHNILGAQSLGFHGIQFKDIAQCREELQKLKILGD